MVRPVHQSDGEPFGTGQMQGDVAAIVDVGAIEPRRIKHGSENFFRDAAGDRGHRRDEMLGRKWRYRRMHAARDDATERAASRIGSLSKLDQLFAEFIEQTVKTPRRSLVGGAHLTFTPLRLDDQIDRTVLQMQPLAVRKKRDLREPLHARRPGM